MQSLPQILPLDTAALGIKSSIHEPLRDDPDQNHIRVTGIEKRTQSTWTDLKEARNHCCWAVSGEQLSRAHLDIPEGKVQDLTGPEVL